MLKGFPYQISVIRGDSIEGPASSSCKVVIYTFMVLKALLLLYLGVARDLLLQTLPAFGSVEQKFILCRVNTVQCSYHKVISWVAIEAANLLALPGRLVWDHCKSTLRYLWCLCVNSSRLISMFKHASCCALMVKSPVFLRKGFASEHGIGW